MNSRPYSKIKSKGKIMARYLWDKLTKEEQDKMLSEKAVLMPAGKGYAHTKYRVLSNPEKLTPRELALIADGGNLCFGFRQEGDIICVYTD